MDASPPSVFCFFREFPPRRDMLKNGGDPSLRSYLFCGAEELRHHGWQVELNLTRTPGTILHYMGVLASRLLNNRGGLSGDFATCFRNVFPAMRAYVLWSTVDTTGIPLACLRSLGLFRKPFLYTSIGLPERISRMKEGRLKRWQLRSLSKATRIICYGWEEARLLRELLGRDVDFVPFGVDTQHWKPIDVPKTVDLLSIGADAMRDFAQLIPFAKANPSRRIRIIGNPENLVALKQVPANVEVSPPVPLSQIAHEMAAARVMAFPIRENSYSGATTTLLQAMSMALPVVVSEVGAIRDGYGFRENQSCILVPPGDPDAFSREIQALLSNPAAAAELGSRARAHVVRDLDWSLYIVRVEAHLRSLLQPDPPSEKAP